MTRQEAIEKAALSHCCHGHSDRDVSHGQSHHQAQEDTVSTCNSGSKLGTGRPATPLQSGLSAPAGLKQAPGLTDKGEERTQGRPSGDDKAH